MRLYLSQENKQIMAKKLNSFYNNRLLSYSHFLVRIFAKDIEEIKHYTKKYYQAKQTKNAKSQAYRKRKKAQFLEVRKRYMSS